MKDWIWTVTEGTIIVMFLGALTGCKTQETAKKQITLRVKIPPLTMVNADTGTTDPYGVLGRADQEFVARYTKWDVTVGVVEFDYIEGDEHTIGCFDTDDVVDIPPEGYSNMSGYIRTGHVVPLDDIITEEAWADVDDMFWKMSQVEGKAYMPPCYGLQNTLIYNRDLFRQCGLVEHVGKDDTTQNWISEEWGYILSTLAVGLPEITCPILVYVKNNQGGTYTMTLLRNKGSPFSDENGRSNFNTKEGIVTLQWIADSCQKGYFSAGCEDMEIVDCSDLLTNNQLAIYMASNATLSGMDRNSARAVDFPSLNGNGCNTSFVTGFEVFDNEDQEKVQAIRDLLRYLMPTRELMNYAQAGTPVSNATVECVSRYTFMQEVYTTDADNTVDFIANNPNWRGVRDVFYIHIHELLVGIKAPQEVAEALDKECDTAIGTGRRTSKLHQQDGADGGKDTYEEKITPMPFNRGRGIGHARNQENGGTDMKEIKPDKQKKNLVKLGVMEESDTLIDFLWVNHIERLIGKLGQRRKGWAYFAEE